jgi:hypothetical protein
MSFRAYQLILRNIAGAEAARKCGQAFARKPQDCTGHLLDFCEAFLSVVRNQPDDVE